MELTQAISMLSSVHLRSEQVQTWADLGCGNGTFTLALAGLLKPGSIIKAIDVDASALRHVPDQFNGVEIKKQAGDFTRQHWDTQSFDGILMANSLHYIHDKVAFIEKSKSWLKNEGSFLVVEYDTGKANRWVPYPLDFAALKDLFRENGFSFIEKINERASVFGRANLYSAIIKT